MDRTSESEDCVETECDGNERLWKTSVSAHPVRTERIRKQTYSDSTLWTRLKELAIIQISQILHYQLALNHSFIKFTYFPHNSHNLLKFNQIHNWNLDFFLKHFFQHNFCSAEVLPYNFFDSYDIVPLEVYWIYVMLIEVVFSARNGKFFELEQISYFSEGEPEQQRNFVVDEMHLTNRNCVDDDYHHRQCHLFCKHQLTSTVS